MKTAPQLAALTLLLFLFGVNVYRAATQSVTADEAMTYNLYVWPRLADTFNSYDANNHVLHTLLCKISVRTFGLTEFGLRVPSLAGGLLFLISVWRLARYVFGPGWFHACAFATVALNPQVLDYLSAARGYGLALGFLFWGLFLLTRYLAEDYDPPVRVLYRAGIVLGLSVTANLVFLVPVAAAGTAFSVLLLASGGRAAFRKRFWLVVDRFWGPALVVAFVLLVLPLTHAGRDNFYYGARSLAEAVSNLVGVSITHKLSVWSLRHYLPHFNQWTLITVYIIIPAITGLVLIAAGTTIFRWARHRDIRALDTEARTLLLAAGTAVLSFAVLAIAHEGMGVLYPLGRTGVYWLPLFTFTAALATAWLWRAGLAGKAAAGFCAVVAVAACGLFLAGFTTDHYSEWRYDAGSRRIIQRLRLLPQPAPPARLRAGCNWLFENSFNFYRNKFHLDGIEPFTRKGPDGDYDAYVLLPEDAGLIQKRGLRVLYRDPVSEATLAVPSVPGAPVR
jgi:hypothetical protein